MEIVRSCRLLKMQSRKAWMKTTMKAVNMQIKFRMRNQCLPLHRLKPFCFVGFFPRVKIIIKNIATMQKRGGRHTYLYDHTGLGHMSPSVDLLSVLKE